MARIDSQILFLTTSPRTPEKMIPEIRLLIDCFAGKKWDSNTQCAFMEILRDEQFFNGKGEKDPAFSARDRINRAPKSLGFVTLSPVISITPAGEMLLSSKHKDEIFLRQMLKFQIPSPYHKPTARAVSFWVRPYLELLRLVRTLGTLRFDELEIFGMQLVDWRLFDSIVQKIEAFRIAKTENKGSYKVFKTEYQHNELTRIYRERISSGQTQTRESNDTSLTKFLSTQSSNMRDYADACFRYLRATGLVNISHVGKSLSIVPERKADVDYILQTVERDPCFIDDKDKYVAYLGNPELPRLLTDDKNRLLEKLRTEFHQVKFSGDENIADLKELLGNLTEQRKTDTLNRQVSEIKDHKLYDDIQDTFRQIELKRLYDAPLMLEWNTWRAMTMLDGGDIKANLVFDDFGKPLSTAQGNMADIVCDYGNYILIVEVTLASGQKQYDMEGEPVSRHLGQIKKSSGKPCYCLFIAPAINEACIAHFYTLQHTNISYYGGKSTIIPLPLEIFQKMLDDSYKVGYTPDANQLRAFLEHSKEIAENSLNEIQWFEEIQKSAINWLG